MWMVGGDVKGGATAGETDDFSLRSAGEAIHIRDVHATLLNLMGLDDEKLEYRQSGDGASSPILAATYSIKS